MYLFIAYLSLVSVVIPLIVWLNRAKENSRSQFLRWMMIFLLLSAVFDLLVYIWGLIGKSSIGLVNIFFILQFYLLSYMYFIYMKNSKLIGFSVAVFTLFVLINTFCIQPFDQIQHLSDGLQSVLLIIYAVACHLYLLDHPSEDERKDSMIFWVNMAFMFYFSLNLYLFISSNYVFTNESSETGLIFWTFHNCFNVIKNAMLAFGIYHASTRRWA